MNDYIIVFSFFGIFVLLTMFLSNLNTKVRKLNKRNQKIKELEQKGYIISKRWDCNYITVGIDNIKKILFIIVLDKEFSFFKLNIDDIINKKINSFGIIKGFVTSVYIDISTKENLTYTIRTLCITRGFGVYKKNKAVTYSKKCAEDICNYIETLHLKNQ